MVVHHRQRLKFLIFFSFSFAFRSLIRNFGFAEATFARKSKRKSSFSFAFRSLIRNFAGKLYN